MAPAETRQNQGSPRGESPIEYVCSPQQAGWHDTGGIHGAGSLWVVAAPPGDVSASSSRARSLLQRHHPVTQCRNPGPVASRDSQEAELRRGQQLASAVDPSWLVVAWATGVAYSEARSTRPKLPRLPPWWPAPVRWQSSLPRQAGGSGRSQRAGTHGQGESDGDDGWERGRQRLASLKWPWPACG